MTICPIALAVGCEDVEVTVAVHVFGAKGHEPCGFAQRVKLPRGEVAGILRAFQPGDWRARTFGAQDHVRATVPVHVQGKGEHPELAPGGGEGFCFPRFRIEIVGFVLGCPVDVDNAVAAFAGADHVHMAILVEVDEDGVLRRGHLADRDGGPELADLVLARM